MTARKLSLLVPLLLLAACAISVPIPDQPTTSSSAPVSKIRYCDPPNDAVHDEIMTLVPIKYADQTVDLTANVVRADDTWEFISFAYIIRGDELKGETDITNSSQYVYKARIGSSAASWQDVSNEPYGDDPFGYSPPSGLTQSELDLYEASHKAWRCLMGG